MFGLLVPAIGALAGLLGKKKASTTPAATSAIGSSSDATLAALMPYIQRLLQAQTSQYLLTNPNAASQLGMTAPANALPLNDALVKAAFGLLPTWARSGLQTPTAPMTPTAPSPRPSQISRYPGY